jgi:hypothetical protein
VRFLIRSRLLTDAELASVRPVVIGAEA